LFTVTVETTFDASHSLAGADGHKEPLHRHNWTTSAEVACPGLDKSGVVMDFGRLKSMLDDIVAGLDNTNLDRNEYFKANNSSAETIAKYIYEKLEVKLPRNVGLAAVTVYEQKGCWAKFTKALNLPADGM